MSENTLYKEAMYAKGLADATDLQARSPEMDSPALYAEQEKIPLFSEAVKVKNMLERHAGKYDGFVCISGSGLIMRLVQNYDSDIYKDDPETLHAQWRYVWSDDPTQARDFLESAVSPYAKGNCCIDVGYVWRSTFDGDNVWRPSTYEQAWEKVGTVEEIMGV